MCEIKTAAFGNKLTPTQTLVHVLEQKDDIEQIVIVWVDKDDYIYTAWADGSMLKRLGMLDMAKDKMMEAATE